VAKMYKLNENARSDLNFSFGKNRPLLWITGIDTMMRRMLLE